MSIPTITPGIVYHNAPTAIEWLGRAFGFQERTVIPGDNDTILHAHLTPGNGGVMLRSAEACPFPHLCKSPRELGAWAEIIVYVADPDSHRQHAVAARAEIVTPIEDKP
ncbi:MAG: hypothetical protein IPH43_14495 [Xanthomonadales bacterium]|uniref:glyoxalase n=1 Tax=Dokdonella sp. TaxID=2291710 RepID=UPI0031C61770|nr:hypothetical protein [Xanthomonadales bacterium]